MSPVACQCLRTEAAAAAAAASRQLRRRCFFTTASRPQSPNLARSPDYIYNFPPATPPPAPDTPRKRKPRGPQKTLSELVSNPAHRTQMYVSNMTNPYVNLAVEHFLMSKSPPDSTVCFLYANDPSVVIGRNQNPWREAHMALLRRRSNVDESTVFAQPPVPSCSPRGRHPDQSKYPRRMWLGPISLVRRRSGGGTVWHDRGNLNYSFIVPPAGFERRHGAEIVVQALQALGVPNVRVNERFDIVVDRAHAWEPIMKLVRQYSDAERADAASAVRAPSTDAKSVLTHKVSGSAFKLTRLRALHHGTCLLESPNLPLLQRALHSPAAAHVDAYGTPSVRSRVANLFVPPKRVQTEIERAFRGRHGGERPDSDEPNWAGYLDVFKYVTEQGIADEAEIWKGVDELASPEWIFGQTPRFRFSSDVLNPASDAAYPEYRPADMKEEGADGWTQIDKQMSSMMSDYMLPRRSMIPARNFKTKIDFEARHGVVQSMSLNDVPVAPSLLAELSELRVWAMGPWKDVLAHIGVPAAETDNAGEWMDMVLGGPAIVPDTLYKYRH